MSLDIRGALVGHWWGWIIITSLECGNEGKPFCLLHSYL